MAQELEPRSYTNVPIGQTFFVLGLLHSEGEFSTAPSVPISDTKLSFNREAFGFTCTFSLAGSSAKVDMEAYTTFDGEYVEGRSYGRFGLAVSSLVKIYNRVDS